MAHNCRAVKTTLYNEGSSSPLFVKWPGVTKPDSVNDTHIIGSIDLLPTFCEMVGQPIPHDLDGRSFVSIIKGENPETWRDFVYKQQNDRNKSRAIQDKEWLYVINPWADGSQKFGSVTSGMYSWKLLTEARDHPESAPQTKAWVNKIEYRMYEELYNVAKDPDCMNNLADDKAYAKQKEMMRKRMEVEVLASGDSMVLDAVRNPRDAGVMKKTVKAIEAFCAKQRNDPDYARDVHFDPFDDWVVIDHTLFEPFGEWGIWQADGDGVALNPDNGHDMGGNSCIQFEGGENARVITSRPIDASGFSQLKLDFRIPNKARRKKGKGDTAGKASLVDNKTKLTFQYKDQQGWHDLQTLEGKKILGDHNLVFDPPKNGWPRAILFGVQVDFGGKNGRLMLDAMRFTGWEDWRVQSKDSFESGLGSWVGSEEVVARESAAVLQGEQAMLALAKPLNVDHMGIIELTYQFRSENFAAGDRLTVEYFTGESWESLATHNYDYVLVAGSTYAGSVELNAEDHMFSPKFGIRFRSEGRQPNRAVYLDEIQLRSRSYRASIDN